MGSDTLNNLMTLWAEGFRAIYPNVNIQIGLHTTFVQKLSLTYYTHNPLSIKASLAGEKS